MKNVMNIIERKLTSFNPNNKNIFYDKYIDEFFISNGFELVDPNPDNSLVDIPFYRKKYDNEFIGVIYMDCYQYTSGYLSIDIHLDGYKDHISYTCYISSSNSNVMMFGVKQVIYTGMESAVDEFIEKIYSEKEEKDDDSTKI